MLGHAVWVLVQVLFGGVQVTAHLCKIDGRGLGRTQSGVLAQVLFWDEVLVMVRVHICKINGRVVWGCCLGVL